MTQAEINRSVRSATGESLREIRRRGFSEADPVLVEYDPEPYSAPNVVDWDQRQACGVAIFPVRSRASDKRLIARKGFRTY